MEAGTRRRTPRSENPDLGHPDAIGRWPTRDPPIKTRLPQVREAGPGAAMFWGKARANTLPGVAGQSVFDSHVHIALSCKVAARFL
jgi:hypothetical protein